MAIYQRGRIWWVDIYRGKNNPRLQQSTGCVNKEDARAVEATLKRAFRKKTPRDRLFAAIENILEEPGDCEILLSEIWDTYQALPENKASHRVMLNRRGDLKRFVRWCNLNWPAADKMQKVNRSCALAFMDSLRGEVAGKSYNNIRANLSVIWSALLIRADLTENVWKLTPTASTEDSRHRRAFTHEEERAVLEASREIDDWYGVCIVARYTGLRKTDILKLEWDNIYDDLIVLVPSKTKRFKTKVQIPIHPRVDEVLRERKDNGSDYVFPGMSKDSRGQRFHNVLTRAKVSDREYILDFHCWRHTFRTRLRDAGVSEKICNELGGWSESGEGDRYDHALEPYRKAIEMDKE